MATTFIIIAVAMCLLLMTFVMGLLLFWRIFACNEVDPTGHFRCTRWRGHKGLHRSVRSKQFVREWANPLTLLEKTRRN